MLSLDIIVYSLTLWLGLYLISRDPTRPRLWLAGGGIVAYALNIASNTLATLAPTADLAALWTRIHWPLIFVPAVFWFGAVIYLLPAAHPLRRRFPRFWPYGLAVLVILFYFLNIGTGLIFDFGGDVPQPGAAYPFFAGAVLLPLLAALMLVIQNFRAAEPKLPLGLILVATIFFGLAASLMLFPLAWLPRSWLLLGIGGDFVLLGGAIAVLDAFDEGETLLPDMTRSFVSALLAAMLFGGMVALTMLLGTGMTWSLVGLLFLTVTLAIATQVFSDAWQSGIDWLSFRAFPRLRQARADLRDTARTLPRTNPSLDFDKLDDKEFTHLTRRALSHMADLPRLAGSPLTYLPLIDKRLDQREARDDTLERAVELKSLLTESIRRLKPRNKGEFGQTDEWRYYNALYFPYVVGLRPYSRRAEHDDLDPVAQEALDWFQTYVPERTLYNWQTAAAKLIAQDIKERLLNGHR